MVEDAPLVEFITFGRGCISDEAYTCTLYLLACQVRVTLGNSGLSCCVSVMSSMH